MRVNLLMKFSPLLIGRTVGWTSFRHILFREKHLGVALVVVRQRQSDKASRSPLYVIPLPSRINCVPRTYCRFQSLIILFLIQLYDLIDVLPINRADSVTLLPAGLAQILLQSQKLCCL